MVKFNGVAVDGHVGTWTQMGEPEMFNFRGKSERLYALENDQYKANANYVVVDDNGKLVADGCMKGLDTVRELMALNRPVSDWKK